MFGPPPYSLVRSIAYKWATLAYPGAPPSPIIVRGYIDVYIDNYGAYWLYCAEKDNGSTSGYLQGPYASNTEAGMAAFSWIAGLGFMHTSGPEGSFPGGGGYSFMAIVIQFHGTEGSWVYSWDSNTYTSIEAAEIAVYHYWGGNLWLLTITKSGEGSTDPPVGTYEYPFEESHTIRVTATNSVSGWMFEKWFVDGAFYDDHNPYDISMNMDHSLTAIFVSNIPPPPGKGNLEVHAFEDGSEVGASVEIVGVGTRTTPFVEVLDPGDYTLNAAYQGQSQTETAAVVEGETVAVDFRFTKPDGTALIVGVAALLLLLGAGYAVYRLAT